MSDVPARALSGVTFWAVAGPVIALADRKLTPHGGRVSRPRQRGCEG